MTDQEIQNCVQLLFDKDLNNVLLGLTIWDGMDPYDAFNVYRHFFYKLLDETYWSRRNDSTQKYKHWCIYYKGKNKYQWCHFEGRLIIMLHFRDMHTHWPILNIEDIYLVKTVNDGWRQLPIATDTFHEYVEEWPKRTLQKRWFDWQVVPKFISLNKEKIERYYEKTN